MHLKRDPLPYITAEPLPRNLLEWHYVVRGPEETPYTGGYYHGILLFPREFPFKPPAIYMLTPNGRFRTNTRLCLSISDFHPDTWNPTWSVSTILTGLLSFMLEKTPTFGSIVSSPYEKQQLARKSLAFNLNDAKFCELFPEICEEIEQKLRNSSQTQQESNKNSHATLVPVRKVNSAGSNEVKDKNVLQVISIKTPKIAVNNARKNQQQDVQLYATNSDSRYAWLTNVVIFFSFAMFLIIVHYIVINVSQ